MSDNERLLFVDTNIWLDFYRSRSEAGLSLLTHLDAIRDRIIMTYQVEMEFKKHRQGAILESFNAMKGPSSIPRPGLFSDAKTVRALQRDLKNADKRVKSLRERLKRVFEKPSIYDPVYKVCQRCFHKNDIITLTRESKTKHVIRRKALRRFLLGYPPRKKNDTSIGDAINWEWIVYCAENSERPIHIVSRDTDYGEVFDDIAYLNDHLLQEFKERVSRKRFISLHTKLSEALKHFEVAVTPEEEAAEKELLEQDDNHRLRRLLNMQLNELGVSPQIMSLFEKTDIQTVATLVTKTEAELLGYKGMTKLDLDKIKHVLASYGLTLGLRISPELMG